MAERPQVLLSVATSIDGYIDDATGTRLMLSNEADLDRVDEVRSGCDAMLAGAGTIRRDRGWPASPVKVTLTGSGELDPAARFFTAHPVGYDEVSRLIYVPDPIADQARARFGAVATVVSAGDPIGLEAVLGDLAARGIRRLMVEGGAMVHAEFLAAGLADELHLVIAPLFVGDPAAPRFGHNGICPSVPAGRVRLAGASQIGDVVLLRYLLSERSGG